MRRMHAGLHAGAGLMLALALTGCADLLSIGGSVGVKADDGAISASDEALQNSNGIKNVFMVYLCGDNNLAGSAESDIQEMIAAGGSDNILAIIVLWDKPGSAEDGIYDITASGPVRVWASPGEINTADPATLSFFLSYVGTTFTADRYILDIWAHGNGFQGAQGVCCDNNAYNRLSIQGVCYDDNPGSYMSIPALESALATGDVHCDLIVFDACLMDMIEVAYEIRNNWEVMVASEENVPLAGYPYTPILTWLRMNAVSSALTVFLARSPFEVNRCTLAADERPEGCPKREGQAGEVPLERA